MKKIITSQEVYDEINRTSILSDKIIELDCEILSFNNLQSNWINFHSCIFKCSEIQFMNIVNPELMIIFENCSFDCDIKIVNCSINEFTFKDTQNLKSLSVERGVGNNGKVEIKQFEFKNDPNKEKPKLNTAFTFKECHFEIFSFQHILHINGIFRFSNNILGNQDSRISHLCLEESVFSNAIFSTNTFKDFTTFHKSKFTYDTEYLTDIGSLYKYTRFFRNTFNKVDFSKCEFKGTIEFSNCDFLSTAWFENCKNLENSELKFNSCRFDGYTLFDNSNLNNFEISHTTFERKASFFNLIVDSIKLHQITFNKVAYFDELTINSIIKNTYLKKATRKKIVEWKHTLRIIKQELQRTENKIDFNRFRNYELATHYKELKFRNNPIDTTILWATKWSSNFGSWIWALCFTLIGALLFYSPFFALEDCAQGTEFCMSKYITGYFRFLIVTDFYNPLSNGREYIANDSWNHIVSWFLFILGKIFIAFGIYEMIQAFRKFKA